MVIFSNNLGIMKKQKIPRLSLATMNYFKVT